MKRVLFDENMPRRLRRDLPSVEVRTVQEESWSGLKNGALLSKAQTGFDVLLTGDQRLQYQQNIAVLEIAVVVIVSRSLRYRHLQPLAGRIEQALQSARPGTVTIVSAI